MVKFVAAFAELQTDMTDLTADLENSGIPTLDHTSYIMKVFFPGVSDHPILNSQKVIKALLLAEKSILRQIYIFRCGWMALEQITTQPCCNLSSLLTINTSYWLLLIF